MRFLSPLKKTFLLNADRPQSRKATRRRGAMMVVIAVLMIGFMAAVAFSVDIAHMHLVRTQLRSATDAAAKAASENLSRNLDVNQAIARGQQIARENTVAGEPLLLDAGDFQFGRSTPDANSRFNFAADGFPRNSVKVLGRRTQGSPSGAVRMFFGNIFGVQFFEPQINSTATFIERDIVLVVDRSGSMAGSNFRNLLSSINIFVTTLQGTPVAERVGLASYSSDATIDSPLVEDPNLINQAMQSLVPAGLTSISFGMAAGEAIFANSRNSEFVEKTMIVMTDGLHNTGPDPIGVANSLASQRTTIHTITFGSGADQARMSRIASIGRGRHFHAVSGAQLEAIYREIALTLSTLITE